MQAHLPIITIATCFLLFPFWFWRVCVCVSGCIVFPIQFFISWIFSLQFLSDLHVDRVKLIFRLLLISQHHMFHIVRKSREFLFNRTKIFEFSLPSAFSIEYTICGELYVLQFSFILWPQYYECVVAVKQLIGLLYIWLDQLTFSCVRTADGPLCCLLYLPIQYLFLSRLSLCMCTINMTGLVFSFSFLFFWVFSS